MNAHVGEYDDYSSGNTYDPTETYDPSGAEDAYDPTAVEDTYAAPEEDTYDPTAVQDTYAAPAEDTYDPPAVEDTYAAPEGMYTGMESYDDSSSEASPSWGEIKAYLEEAVRRNEEETKQEVVGVVHARLEELKQHVLSQGAADAISEYGGDESDYGGTTDSSDNDAASQVEEEVDDAVEKVSR